MSLHLPSPTQPPSFQPGCIEQVEELTLFAFVELFKNQIVSLLNQLGKKQHINMEGAHIYTDEIPAIMHFAQMKIAALLKEFLLNAEKGHSVSTMLFVDDYHPVQHVLDIDAYCVLAKQYGLEFDSVVLETAMVASAQHNHQKLQSAGKTKINNGYSVLSPGGQHLIKPDGELSCGLLDATLSVKKLESADAGVIVLPYDYKSEQKNMRTILKALLQLHGQPGVIHSFLT
jgi:hypothetical protein